jgi:hypothetical protein
MYFGLEYMQYVLITGSTWGQLDLNDVRAWRKNEYAVLPASRAG